jgi:hypothetical protein
MVDVPNLSDAADKFEARASQAGPAYEAGVGDVSDSEQQDATLDASDTWEQGIQEAITEGRFSEGVRNPDASWQTKALQQGSTRFTQGVSNAGSAWESGFSDYASTLESLTLQPRGARGSQANFQRSRSVGEALHNERQG